MASHNRSTNPARRGFLCGLAALPAAAAGQPADHCLVDPLYELREAFPVAVPIAFTPLHKLVDVRNGGPQV